MAPKRRPQTQPWRILLLGDGGVGKSSLAYRFEYDTFIEDMKHDLTIEEYRKDILIDGVAVNTALLDTWSNQASPEAIDGMIRVGQAFILVYSVSGRYSFEDTVSHCKKVRQATQDPRAICALVGNKCDLSFKREVSTEEGRALAQELDCEFSETSAKTGENLELVVRKLVQRLRIKHSKIETKLGRSPSIFNFLCCK